MYKVGIKITAPNPKTVTTQSVKIAIEVIKDTDENLEFINLVDIKYDELDGGEDRIKMYSFTPIISDLISKVGVLIKHLESTGERNDVRQN